MVDFNCATVTSSGCVSNSRLSSLASWDIVPGSATSGTLNGMTFSLTPVLFYALFLANYCSPHCVPTGYLCVFGMQHICHRWYRSHRSAMEIWREQLQLMTNRQTAAEWVMRLRVCVWSRKAEHTTKLKLIDIYIFKSAGTIRKESNLKINGNLSLAWDHPVNSQWTKSFSFFFSCSRSLELCSITDSSNHASFWVVCIF